MGCLQAAEGAAEFEVSETEQVVVVEELVLVVDLSQNHSTC